MKKDIYELARDFWATPSFMEPDYGMDIKYTPSQVAMNNRRKAGLYCYEGGYKQGYKDAIEDIRNGNISIDDLPEGLR